MGRLSKVLTWTAAVAAVLLASTAAWAAERSVTVVGSGEAGARPTRAEVLAKVTGEGPLAADAAVKYRDAQRQAEDVIEKLGVEGLSLEPQGVTVRPPGVANPMAAMMGMGNEEGDGSNFAVAKDLKVVLDGVDKLDEAALVETLVKVLDAMKDAGLTIGAAAPSNILEAQMAAMRGGGGDAVTFRLADAEAVREKAYEAALADAGRKAERLARLSNMTLGPVISITEGAAPAGDEAEGNPYMAMIFGMAGGGERLTGGSTAEIPVRVSLTVQFELRQNEEPAQP